MKLLEEKANTSEFNSIRLIKQPVWFSTLARLLVFSFLLLACLLTFLPWQQSSKGYGKVIAFDPNDRVQNINSTLPGRISRWLVSEGSKVKKGDPIVEIIDNDPNLMERLKLERDSIYQNYQAAKAASETSYLNYKRQGDLFKQGLSSQTKFEKAKIEYKKLLSKESSAAAKLATAEVKLSRQQTQLIQAPRDGTILKVLHGTGSVYVKEGDILAKFVPETDMPAVELFINGNDLPLIFPGRHVRLQFEGWPAIQFSGWPSVAIGTFGGEVQIVDSFASSAGKFRVIVTPIRRRDWPDSRFLRQGTRVHGWIMLNEVRLGYELWRQFNAFPPSLDTPPDLILQKKDSKEDDKKQKKESKYEEEEE